MLFIPPSRPAGSAAFQPPSSEQLLGQWFIVHSSLPYWSNKRNLQITYSRISTSDSSTDLEDTITYQSTSSDKIKTIQGVNTLAQSEHQGAWDWRGCGWVKIVSNHWEILGHGNHEAGDWIAIHTQKSFFAPAAIHVYSRVKDALPEEIKDTLTATLMQHQDLKALIECLFRVRQD